jgi:hypothetical protein
MLLNSVPTDQYVFRVWWGSHVPTDVPALCLCLVLFLLFLLVRLDAIAVFDVI